MTGNPGASSVYIMYLMILLMTFLEMFKIATSGALQHGVKGAHFPYPKDIFCHALADDLN